MSGKNNFLLEKSQGEVFNELSDNDAGKLIKGVYNYVNTGDSGLDGYLKIVFIPIKTKIDENEESYQKRCEINKINGSKGGAPKGNTNAKKSETTENNQSVSETTENNMNDHNHIHIHNHNHKLNNNLDIIKQVIDYLNNKNNSKYKYSTKTTQDKINARLNEGYKLDDFIAVIDKKVKEWSNTEMGVYIRPETLFGNKFESYLNQKRGNKNEEELAKQKVNIPNWYNKDIEKEQASKEEVEKMRIEMEKFK